MTSLALKKQRIRPFRFFMINWLGVLAIVISVFLGRFYTFLEEYENAYQASRPHHVMDSLMPLFDATDTGAIYDLMTVKPAINEFESEENVKRYMSGLLSGKEFTYFEAADSTNDNPRYYIAADGYTVAKVTLGEISGESYGYNFPKWQVSGFDFYTDAQYSIRLEKPSSHALEINGLPVSDSYAYEQDIAIEDAHFFEPYLDKLEYDFPSLEKYYADGFYEKPEVKAYDAEGCEADVVFDESRGMMSVPFESGDYDELIDFATNAVSDYAFYVSGDVSAGALDKYFPKGSELLKMIKHGTSQKWFMKHSRTFMDNVEVGELTVYTPECVYVGLTMDQHFISGKTDTVIRTNGNFCYVKIDDKWKICGIKY